VHHRTRTSIARLAALAAALTLLAAAVPAPAAAGSGHPCGPIRAIAGEASQATVESAVLCLLNRHRARHRLKPLKSNRRLVRAARAHAQDMVARQFFSHVSPEGRDFLFRIRATGYTRARRWIVGENIAWGSHELSMPEVIVRNWMTSPTHRRNVLSRRFREIGVAASWGAPARAQPPAATYVTTFGRVTR
jgi:uncharacterized protein YkwD